jgi:hypothetical protein
MQLALLEDNIKSLNYVVERGNPHRCEGEDNQLKNAIYDENNLASIKYSVRSCTPYSYRKRAKRVGTTEKRMAVRSTGTRGKQGPLTDNADSTQNTQDCADSITCIAAVK